MVTSTFGSAPRPARPWYHPLHLIRWAIACLVILYLIPGIYLYFIQTDLIYHPVPVTATEAEKQTKAVNLVLWDHTTPGASGPQGYVRPDFASPAPRGTIVFFHGNGDPGWASVESVGPLTQRGFRVFLYEYPGFGTRPGVPTEKTIVPDARALIRSLEQADFGPIYVWGESLGSGVAAAVCADQSLPVHGLTLVVPWDTLPNVAQSYYPYYPVRFFMTDLYDSVANLQQFHHPICLIRGDEDDTIFPPLSINLFAHLPNPKKEIVKVGYGHGDWPMDANLSWWDEAIDFMAPKNSAGL